MTGNLKFESVEPPAGMWLPVEARVAMLRYFRLAPSRFVFIAAST